MVTLLLGVGGRCKENVSNIDSTITEQDTVSQFFNSDEGVNSGILSYFPECCIELTIMIDNKVDNNTISKFNGHYTIDINKATEDELKTGKFLYTQKMGKHYFYKTSDGVWAVSIKS